MKWLLGSLLLVAVIAVLYSTPTIARDRRFRETATIIEQPIFAASLAPGVRPQSSFFPAAQSPGARSKYCLLERRLQSGSPHGTKYELRDDDFGRHNCGIEFCIRLFVQKVSAPCTKRLAVLASRGTIAAPPRFG